MSIRFTAKRAKQAHRAMMDRGWGQEARGKSMAEVADLVDAWLDAYAAEQGWYEADQAIDQTIEAAINDNPKAWEAYVSGNDKAVGPILGAIGRNSKDSLEGEAMITELLHRARRGIQ